MKVIGLWIGRLFGHWAVCSGRWSGTGRVLASHHWTVQAVASEKWMYA